MRLFLLAPLLLAGCRAPARPVAPVVVRTFPKPTVASISVGMEMSDVFSRYGPPERHMGDKAGTYSGWGYSGIGILAREGQVVRVFKY